jgi:ATP-dependent Clp protease ATP-binding subunit ClpX
MFKLRRLRCSFCGKSEAEVLKLVAGPRVYICDGCVAVASRLMGDDSPDGERPHAAAPSVWRRLSERVRRLLRADSARRVRGFVG